MGEIRQSHLRLQYSLLRLAARAAAQFQVPVRTLGELLRMAYYEHLRNEGLAHNAIARHMDQTDRNVRYYALRFREGFLSGEVEPEPSIPGPVHAGLLREAFGEELAALEPTFAALHAAVMQRLVYDESVAARIQSHTFHARQAELDAFADALLARLHKGLAELEESAASSGTAVRYSLNLTLAPSAKGRVRDRSS